MRCPSKLHQRHAPHVLACAARRFYFFIHMPHATTRTCAHVPHASHAPTRLTCLTRLTRPTCPTLLQQPANVICDVILLTSTAMAALRLRHHPRHLADVIALLLTFEEGWSLTFSRVKFLQSRCSLSIFLRWFNFVVHFCIFCFKMKSKYKSSFYCNNRRRQSNKHFYKRLGHNIETCY